MIYVSPSHEAGGCCHVSWSAAAIPQPRKRLQPSIYGWDIMNLTFTHSNDEGRNIAVVTGASKGVGRGIAVALAEAGFDIAVNYRGDSKGADLTADSIRAIGRNALVVQADVGFKPVPGELVFTAQFLILAVLAKMLRCAISSSFSSMSSLRLPDSGVRAASVLWSPSPFLSSILNRSRQRSPNLLTSDRLVAGLCALLIR